MRSEGARARLGARRLGQPPAFARVVDVQVITARTDAATWFARAYGPLVRVEVIGDRFECRGSYSGG